MAQPQNKYRTLKNTYISSLGGVSQASQLKMLLNSNYPGHWHCTTAWQHSYVPLPHWRAAMPTVIGIQLCVCFFKLQKLGRILLQIFNWCRVIIMMIVASSNKTKIKKTIKIKQFVEVASPCDS